MNPLQVLLRLRRWRRARNTAAWNQAEWARKVDEAAQRWADKTSEISVSEWQQATRRHRNGER